MYVFSTKIHAHTNIPHYIYVKVPETINKTCITNPTLSSFKYARFIKYKRFSKGLQN